jgi:hypothetical protein
MQKISKNQSKLVRTFEIEQIRTFTVNWVLVRKFTVSSLIFFDLDKCRNKFRKNANVNLKDELLSDKTIINDKPEKLERRVSTDNKSSETICRK